MREPASAHGQDGPGGQPDQSAVATSQHMVHHTYASDGRYAGLDTGDSFLLYDTEQSTAWIESDTTQTIRT